MFGRTALILAVTPSSLEMISHLSSFSSPTHLRVSGSLRKTAVYATDGTGVQIADVEF
jgi:hypothetical protein